MRGSTYNTYQCKCGYMYDAIHASLLIIQAICPTCGSIVDHVKQVDYDE